MGFCQIGPKYVLSTAMRTSVPWASIRARFELTESGLQVDDVIRGVGGCFGVDQFDFFRLALARHKLLAQRGEVGLRRKMLHMHPDGGEVMVHKVVRPSVHGVGDELV